MRWHWIIDIAGWMHICSVITVSIVFGCDLWAQRYAERAAKNRLHNFFDNLESRRHHP